jgi:predicted Zn-dependent peptidase
VYKLVDVGILEAGAGLPKDKLKDAVGLMLEIMYGLGGSGKWGITKKELEEAKVCSLGRFALSNDVPENVLSSALYDLNFEGKIYTPDEIRANIKGVTLDQVKEVCELVFRRDHLSLVVVGDYESLPFSI